MRRSYAGRTAAGRGPPCAKAFQRTAVASAGKNGSSFAQNRGDGPNTSSPRGSTGTGWSRSRGPSRFSPLPAWCARADTIGLMLGNRPEFHPRPRHGHGGTWGRRLLRSYNSSPPPNRSADDFEETRVRLGESRGGPQKRRRRRGWIRRPQKCVVFRVRSTSRLRAPSGDDGCRAAAPPPYPDFRSEMAGGRARDRTWRTLCLHRPAGRPGAPRASFSLTHDAMARDVARPVPAVGIGARSPAERFHLPYLPGANVPASRMLATMSRRMGVFPGDVLFPRTRKLVLGMPDGGASLKRQFPSFFSRRPRLFRDSESRRSWPRRGSAAPTFCERLRARRCSPCA